MSTHFLPQILQWSKVREGGERRGEGGRGGEEGSTFRRGKRKTYFKVGFVIQQLTLKILDVFIFDFCTFCLHLLMFFIF